MRKVLAYFIKYPVAVNVIILAFVLLGYLGYKNLNSSFFPLTPNKFIRINAFYPGASPYEIEQGIVLKIEENLKGLVGIDRVTSSSSENAGNITIEIEKGQDINNILAEVKNAVDKVPNFPSAMEPPVIGKIENIRETIVLIVTGENADLFALKSSARKIENEIRKIDGISQIEIEGFPNEEINSYQ